MAAERTVNVRWDEEQLAHLDAVAASRGLRRGPCIRALVMEASVGAAPGDVPTEEELLELLAGRARAGNVSAIRALQAWHREQRAGGKGSQAPGEAPDRMAELEPPTLRVVA